MSETELDDLRMQIVGLDQDVRELEEALEFYANEAAYRKQPVPDAERGHYPEYVPVLKDKGQRARSALAPQHPKGGR